MVCRDDFIQNVLFLLYLLNKNVHCGFFIQNCIFKKVVNMTGTVVSSLT